MIKRALEPNKYQLVRKIINNFRNDIVVVDGCRIPFTVSGTLYSNYMAVDLARLCLNGLVNKTAIDPGKINYVSLGVVLQEPKTSNIAREASVLAGIPNSVPGHTISEACISANEAIHHIAEKIACGKIDIGIGGGVETFSDIPFRFSRSIRQRLIKASKIKTITGYLPLLKGVKWNDIVGYEGRPTVNYNTGESMGLSSERLAKKFGVTRNDMDQFAVMSHARAAEAHKKGLYAEEITPIASNYSDANEQLVNTLVTTENGIKGDSRIEKVSRLAPAFLSAKEGGTHTAANSSFLTDGASAVLIMSKQKAIELGYVNPKAYIRDWVKVAVNPWEELLLGPTFAIEKILLRNKLALSDIGVIEFHEAFAGQVCANMNALDSEKFAKERFMNGKPIGRLDMTITNTLGGSLSIGHPFGATGGRLVTTACNRLQRENKRFALIAACANGGLAAGMLLERCG